MGWNIKTFDSNDALVAALAAEIVSILRAAIQRTGRASMAVSGGSTPKPLFARLAMTDLDWEKVTITLVDERWVEEDHPDSNARLVKDYLLRNQAESATFIGLKDNQGDPFSAEEMVAQRLRSVSLPFDLVILGMGNDGHTASFFPGAATLARALTDEGSLCCGVRPPAAPHDRMTLTLPTLLSARRLFLHLVGEAKWEVLQRAMESGSREELPIRAVLHQDQTLLDIYYAAE